MRKRDKKIISNPLRGYLKKTKKLLLARPIIIMMNK
jgi:hypothetical protein